MAKQPGVWRSLHFLTWGSLAIEKYCNGSELAIILGVTGARVVQLHEQGMPKFARGKYDIAECVQWVIARWMVSSTNDKSLDEQRKALLYEQTLKTQLENRTTEAKLFDGDEVQGALEAIMVLFVGQLDALAPRVCNRFAGITDAGQIKAELFEECREVRRTLSEALEGMGGYIQSPGKPGKTAATPKSKPVGGRGKNTSTRKPRARAVAQ